MTVCQEVADSLDNGNRIDAIIIDFSKAFDLVPYDRLLTKIAASGANSRVVIWTREFLLGRTQRVRVGGHLSEEGANSRVVIWTREFLLGRTQKSEWEGICRRKLE
jgi:hypothetical protein